MEVDVDVVTVLDSVAAAPGMVLVRAGIGNLAVQYVCAAGHGRSTDANVATLPEHGREVAAYEMLPCIKAESKIVPNCEDLIFKWSIGVEI